MYVWVNTAAGWIVHGRARVSESRAADVAKLLLDKCGWETAWGVQPPPPRPASIDAPSPELAARSPIADDCGDSGAQGSRWRQSEVELLVADYFAMLQIELIGQRINKAAHNRSLQRLLPARLRGSIEFKHQNVSAILLELGMPYVSGYQPMRNYQELLRRIVVERLGLSTDVQRAVAEAVEAPVAGPPLVSDILSILVDPPDSRDRRSYAELRERLAPAATVVNWLEREAGNRSLGAAGERMVLEFEHRRLWDAKRRDLADRVEHVSSTKGDGLGYDVQSFEVHGAARLIEVKTTRYGAMTPFFASRNEVSVSKDRSSEYHLYRLFKFEAAPRMFQLRGALSVTCDLDPVQYSATVK